ncbi:uncharacterized protein LOC135388350 isoform X2 [Ornithodoros turicata]|uniref:uncharacterized protein LOC135388350 isoform X2 n=1 Tax=Ornithodoros turicata TaxID=34597 RepID=UPI00313A4B92
METNVAATSYVSHFRRGFFRAFWRIACFNYMNMDHITISLMEQAVLRRESPTDELLHKWGEKNGTVNQLFVYLYKMKHMQAMLIIKEFVNPKYHHLLERQQTTELDSALLSDSCGWKASQYECSAPPMSFAANDYNKKLYAEDCNWNMRKSQVLSKVESGKVKLGLSSGLPGQGSRSRNHTTNGIAPPSISNNNVGQVSQRIPVTQRTTEGKVQNVAGSVPEASQRHASAASRKDIGDIQPLGHSIPYSEIVHATDNFCESHILGKGGFGTVYKGLWKDTTVAIKRLHLHEKDSDVRQEQNMKQSLTELRVLQSFRFDSILPLYGVSLDGPEPCIVYQYMKNGSLEDRLRCKNNTPPLNWNQRGVIAKGTARGLHFLHTFLKGQPHIHGDIKSANILLDLNLEPKIGDFGLTKAGPPTDMTHIVVSHVHGTRYYLPHEYLKNRQLSTKVDIYSYGIVLLELATSKHVFDRRRSKTLMEHVADCAQSNQLDSLRDGGAGDENTDWFPLLIHLGQKCSSYNRKDRPEMEEVLQHFKEGPTEAVRKLSISALPSGSPKQESSSPPSPLDIQRWYDIRQAAMQSNRPTFLTPTTSPLSTAPNVPTSPRHSPNFLGRPSSSVVRTQPSDVVSTAQPPDCQQPSLSIGLPQQQPPRKPSFPGDMLPMITELGVSHESASASQSSNSQDRPKSQGTVSPADDRNDTSGTTTSSGCTTELSDEGRGIFINQDLRSAALELPDIADINLSELLSDDDDDDDGVSD